MTVPTVSTNSRPMKTRRLLFISSVLLWFLPLFSFAHPSPNTLIFLDASPGRVTLEVQMPVPELELAFGHDISKNPETIVDKWGPQLREYLLAHIHAYITKGRPWAVAITGLRMDHGQYADSNIPYWEVSASITLTPQPGDDTRKFFLDYDVIMHQVINHAALVSVRSDWETGALEGSNAAEPRVIQWSLRDNNVPPLEVNLEKGSSWKGFTGMINLGVRHIAEGTDHLMFLLVLLLPAPLVVVGKRWGGFGGTRYSIFRLLRIVTAFTIGHSITLLLGATGWLRVPGQPVEILIAFSIFVSALHALRPIFPGKEMFVAAGFGLIHGMAFASTIANLNLNAGPMALSILGFNLGIELMQLFVIAITVPWLIILSKKLVYTYVRITGAVFAAIAALAWMGQRYLQKSNPLSNIVDAISSQGKWMVLGLAVLAIIAYFLPGQKGLKIVNKKAV